MSDQQQIEYLARAQALVEALADYEAAHPDDAPCFDEPLALMRGGDGAVSRTMPDLLRVMIRHPDCPHPVTNASDDYSGVSCCICDDNRCPDVTDAHHRDHQLWELEMWAVAR